MAANEGVLAGIKALGTLNETIFEACETDDDYLALQRALSGMCWKLVDKVAEMRREESKECSV